MSEHEFKVGQKVRCVRARGARIPLTDGKQYEIVEFDGGDPDFPRVMADDGFVSWVSGNRFEPLPAEPRAFQVGDRVRVKHRHEAPHNLLQFGVDYTVEDCGGGLGVREPEDGGWWQTNGGLNTFELVEAVEDIKAREEAETEAQVDARVNAELEATPLLYDKAPPSEAASILREAASIVDGARNVTHGDKERSFETIAALWGEYLRAVAQSIDAEVVLSPRDVAVMMALLKVARMANGRPERDHFVDAAGYMGIAGELAV